VDLVDESAERIYGITYHISSSPYYSESIHTLVLPGHYPKESKKEKKSMALGGNV